MKYRDLEASAKNYPSGVECPEADLSSRVERPEEGASLSRRRRGPWLALS